MKKLERIVTTGLLKVKERRCGLHSYALALGSCQYGDDLWLPKHVDNFLTRRQETTLHEEMPSNPHSNDNNPVRHNIT